MKDAKGHGSDSHGGATDADRIAASRLALRANESAAHQQGVQKIGTPVPAMQQRHFQMIADTLAAHKSQVRTDPIAHSALVGMFADRLAQSNPKFNKQMFTKAAGG